MTNFIVFVVFMAVVVFITFKVAGRIEAKKKDASSKSSGGGTTRKMNVK